MTTRTGGAPAARKQLSPVDGLAQLSFLIQGLLERRAAEHDLSIIQTRLLGVLRDRTPTMNELARFLGLDKSSVTGLVDRAERRGLVARVPSTTDRRAVLVSLTDEGRSFVSQAAAAFEADVSALLSRLPPRERETLSRIVSRLLVAHASDQRHRPVRNGHRGVPLGSGRCGAIDGDVPGAAREVQRPDNQEEGRPSLDAVREAYDARGGRDTATGNTREPEGAEVAVLPWVDQALHAGSRRSMPTTRAGLSQRCCRWERSCRSPPADVVPATRSPINVISP